MFRGLPRRLSLAYGLLISATVTALGLLAAEDPEHIARNAFLVGLGATAVGWAMAYLLTYRRLRTIRHLTEVALSMARGRFGQRVVGEAPDEAGELAYAFNRMADAVGELVARLSQERSRLAAAYESSSNGIVAVTRGRLVAYINPAAAQIFGTGAEDAVGRPFIELVRDHELYLMLERSLDQGERQNQVVDFGPDHLQLRAVVFPIQDGGDWAALAVLTDVTESRRLEVMRRDFVANVSHELRTPLAAIKAAVETLQVGALEEPALARDFLSRIDAEVERLARMTEGLLDLHRLEAGPGPALAPVDVTALLQEVAERMRPMVEKRSLHLSLDVAQGLPPLLTDGERLQEAVVNLVHNALKFTPAGGRVWVSAAREGDCLAIKVADTGPGMAPEEMPRVFERFYKADRSRSSEGVGLGLAIVKHIAQALGGQVTTQSEVGKGSTFTILLPYRLPS